MNRKRHTDPQRGSALTMTMAVTASLLPLAAFSLLLTRGSFYIQNNTRAQAEAFYVAEAGMTHALADIAPAVVLDTMLDGPDKQHGTADDGGFPFREGVPGYFPSAPLRYDVTVAKVSNGLFRLTSTGYGVRNAQSVVEALAARDPQPSTPAALYSPTVGGVAIGHDFLVSGLDHVAGDTPDHATGTGAPLPAIGVGSDTAADALRASLGASALAQLVGKDGAGSIADVVGADLDALIGTLAATSGSVSLPVSALAPGAHLGTSTTPQVTVLNNDGVLTNSVDGFGILVAPAGLRIGGAFSFSGVVLVRGNLTFDSSSAVRVDGSVAVGGAISSVALDGSGAVTYDRAALGTIDQQLPGLLPHGVLLKGWREVF